MAMRQCCDAYETPNGVERWEVCVRRIDDEGNMIDGVDPVLLKRPHLSPRGLARLLTKIETGTTPPKKRKKEDHGS